MQEAPVPPPSLYNQKSLTTTTKQQVESLTLRGNGHQTTHRRVPALPQLRCVSSAHPRLCAKHAVDLMRCENKGGGYGGPEDVQWSCHAQLPPELKLGATDVTCEGYAGPDDPYVLKGSCAVEYRLALTPAGEEKWPDLAGGGDDDEYGGQGGGGGGGGPFAVLFWVIFVAVVGWIVYSAWTESQRNRGARPAGGNNNNNNFWGGGGGGGGGGDDGWEDPPPPYPGTNNNNAPRRNNKRSSGPRTNNNRQQSDGGWRNSLLGGAAGAAAGYYFGSRGRNNNGAGRTNYGSTWGSGAAGSSRSASSSSSSAASSSRYESTGFGSTSRR